MKECTGLEKQTEGRLNVHLKAQALTERREMLLQVLAPESDKDRSGFRSLCILESQRRDIPKEEGNRDGES